MECNSSRSLQSRSSTRECEVGNPSPTHIGCRHKRHATSPTNSSIAPERQIQTQTSLQQRNPNAKNKEMYVAHGLNPSRLKQVCVCLARVWNVIERVRSILINYKCKTLSDRCFLVLLVLSPCAQYRHVFQFTQTSLLANSNKAFDPFS